MEKKKKQGNSIYIKNILQREVVLPFSVISSNMKQNILKELKDRPENLSPPKIKTD